MDPSFDDPSSRPAAGWDGRREDARRRAEAALQQSIDRRPPLTWSTDPGLRLTACSSPGLGRLSPNSARARLTLAECLVGVSHPEGALLRLHEQALAGRPGELELWCDGRSLRARVEPFQGEDGTVQGTVGVAWDVSDVRAAEARLRRVSTEDALTGLLSRGSWLEQLRQAFARADRTAPGGFGILLIGLDRLQSVNEREGMDQGDHLLREVAARLRVALVPGDLAGRVQGSTLAVLLEDLADGEDARRRAERVRKVLCTGTAALDDLSLGLAVRAERHAASDGLLRDALRVLRRARSLGAGRCEVFDPAGHDAHLSLQLLEADLRRTLDRHELRVHYEPSLAVKAGRVTGFEVLLWKRGGAGRAALAAPPVPPAAGPDPRRRS